MLMHTYFKTLTTYLFPGLVSNQETLFLRLCLFEFFKYFYWKFQKFVCYKVLLFFLVLDEIFIKFILHFIFWATWPTWHHAISMSISNLRKFTSEGRTWLIHFNNRLNFSSVSSELELFEELFCCCEFGSPRLSMFYSC